MAFVVSIRFGPMLEIRADSFAEVFRARTAEARAVKIETEESVKL
jgi:hypothetical protein